MRNLKRALSLVMAAAMLIGMMVVSASAATTYEDFTDKDEIKNTEAVATMVSLGVIAGKEDGSYFDPTGTVTRGEMAKLIAVSLYGGRDLVLGSGASATQFSDTKGHWAEAYIAYCANLGIINGKGDGTFGPNEPVTGTAAAKMFLCALGYKADIEGLTGAGWDLNTDSLAMKSGLYDDMNITPSDGLSRDNTAQLVYNGVQAQEVEYRNLYGEFSDRVYPVENGTMLANRFGVVKVEGVAVANDVFAVDGGTRTVAGKVRLDDTNTYTTSNNQIRDYDGTYTISVPNDMVGRRIVIYVKFPNALAPNAANSVVVGQPILSNLNNVATTSNKLKDTDAVKSFLTSNGLSVTTRANADANGCEGVLTVNKDGSTLSGSTPALANAVTSDPGVEQVFIDHNGDSVVDYLISTTDQMAKVTVYGNDKLTIAGAGSISFKDAVGYEDVARDDIVLYHKLNETYYIYKAESVSGTVTAYNHDNKTIAIDGSSYKRSLVAFTAASTDLTGFTAGETLVGDGYTLYMDRFGNVVAKAVYEETVGNYALVLDTAVTPGIGTQGKVKLLLADGTTATYDVNVVSSWNRLTAGASLIAGLTHTANATTAQKETAMTTALTKSGTSPLMYNIVTYSVNSAGEVTLGAPDVGDYGAVQKTATGDEAGRKHNAYTFSGVPGTVVPNDSTVYFFYDAATGTANVSVGLSSLSNEIASTDVSGAVYYNNSNAVGRLTARALYVDGVYAGSKSYVYISGDFTMTLNSNNERVYTYPVVNTDGTTGTIQCKAADGIKGQVFEYTLDGDGYADLDQVNPGLNQAGEVNGYVTTYVDGGMSVARVARGVYKNDNLVYSIASNVKVYNVENTDNVYEETLTDGMSISFTVNGDGYIDNIFVKKVNVAFREVTVGSDSVTIAANGQFGATTLTNTTFEVANGFDIKVTRGSNLTYTVTNDNGTVTHPTANSSNGVVTITMPENSVVNLAPYVAP